MHNFNTDQSLQSLYLKTIEIDLYDDILAFTRDIESYYEMRNFPEGESENYTHKDRIIEWTTHPSQTWDTLAKQRRREVKNTYYTLYKKDKNNGFSLRSQKEWINEYAQTFARENAKEIQEECSKRMFSLENAKIPAHSEMTPDLLQKVPMFFQDYDQYSNLSGWQKKIKAEEKNTSFMAFLDEEKLPLVYLDERWEAIETAKRTLQIGMDRFYMWIDFDGAKRPDGIMISIFAHMIIMDINMLGQGVHEQECIERGSLFTLAEREQNRSLVFTFERIDKAIYALTRQMVSSTKYSQNPICISQMEQLKQERAKTLTKLIQVRDITLERAQENKRNINFCLSNRSHFIPRFDPKFIHALQKSKLGQCLETLSETEIESYNTVSHIIDQVLLINELSPDRVCQIILAQAQNAKDIITLDQFLEKKVHDWREKKSEYFSPSPIENISLCPLFETEKSTTPKNIQKVLDDLWSFYNKNQKTIELKIPELFFAGSDLSKSIGCSSAYTTVHKAGEIIDTFNKDNKTDIRVKLGSGESYFRQNGFLDPEHKKNIRVDKKILEKPYSGLASLMKKSTWLNSITLQSKAREWIFEVSPSNLKKQVFEIQTQKKANLQTLTTKKVTPLPKALIKFASEEKELYQKFLGTEDQQGKLLFSLGSLLELFAGEMSPLLRDRALKRGHQGSDSDGKIICTRLTSSPGINSRAIAANTASSFLFPLGLLGKGSGFKYLADNHTHEEIKEVYCFFEPAELLQNIREYSCIAPSFFEILSKYPSSFGNDLLNEWEWIQKSIPYIVEALWEKIGIHNPQEQKKTLPFLDNSFRSILDISTKNNRIEFNYSTEKLNFLTQNWNKNAKNIVEKACDFLQSADNSYPFTQDDKRQWDTMMTMSCRMRRGKGILG